MQYFRQRRGPTEARTHVLSLGGEHDNNQQIESERASRERLEMAVNHLLAFVLIFYGLYALCRFGLGYDPIRDPPPPSITIEIPWLTNVQSRNKLRGSPP